MVSDLKVWPARESLVVADYLNNTVIAINTHSAVATTLCAEGSGPGEVRGPMALRVDADQLWVLDSGNHRLIKVSNVGEALESHALNMASYATSGAIGAGGTVLNPTGGFDGSYATLFDTAGILLRSLGTAVPVPSDLSPIEVRRTLAAGEVPALFRNNVIGALADDGNAYLASLGEPVVVRYDASGAIVWRIVVDAASQREAVASYLEDNRRERNPSRVHPIRLFADIEISGNDVWLLNSPRSPSAAAWRLDRESGTLRGMYRFPGIDEASAFAVDLEGESVAVLDARTGRLVTFWLSGALGEPGTGSRR
jgi:hypothetical protein